MYDELSKYLKECRKIKKLSQKSVLNLTGITDSRLSRIETGKSNINILSPEEFHKLVKLYDIPAVNLLIKSGYLNKEDLQEYQTVFNGASLLDKEEFAHVQTEIDFINRKRGAL